MNKNKCIYCDFNHPDHIGAEIYSGEYIPEEEMYDSEWEDGVEYAFLKQKKGYFVLVTLHTDNEFYSSDGDATVIKFCPICGRDFNDTKKCVRNTKMTDDIKEVQELAKYYQNYAEYYHEKATWWHKQSYEDEAERERLIDLMNQIYVLTGHDPEETVDDLAEKLDQIKELTKKA